MCLLSLMLWTGRQAEKSRKTWIGHGHTHWEAAKVVEGSGIANMQGRRHAVSHDRELQQRFTLVKFKAKISQNKTMKKNAQGYNDSGHSSTIPPATHKTNEMRCEAARQATCSHDTFMLRLLLLLLLRPLLMVVTDSAEPSVGVTGQHKDK